jgi:hypothetical protein
MHSEAAACPRRTGGVASPQGNFAKENNRKGGCRRLRSCCRGRRKYFKWCSENLNQSEIVHLEMRRDFLIIRKRRCAAMEKLLVPT